MNKQNKITVVLVDDSSVIRGVLTRMIEQDPNIEITGSVSNGQMAVSIATLKKPDIMILDVEMPVMDGLTALPQILKQSPQTKVIMCSSLTAKGADTTMKAMTLGAVECIVKPTSAQETGIGSSFQKTLLDLIRTLGTTNTEMSPIKSTSSPVPNKTSGAQATAPQLKSFTLRNDFTAYKGRPSILAIGSSTGGPQALFKVLKTIGTLRIPIVITQHMPATFTRILAEHIQQHTGTPSFEGEDGMLVEAGKIYVAPGGKHMLFENKLGKLTIKINDGPPENFCKPAVDPMLRSLIEIYGQRTLCVILTGMGQDGLKGAQALVETGGRVIAQDEATSIVWGMPGAVAMNGICSAVLPLDDIGTWVKSVGC